MYSPDNQQQEANILTICPPVPSALRAIPNSEIKLVVPEDGSCMLIEETFPNYCNNTSLPFQPNILIRTYTISPTYRTIDNFGSRQRRRPIAGMNMPIQTFHSLDLIGELAGHGIQISMQNNTFRVTIDGVDIFPVENMTRGLPLCENVSVQSPLPRVAIGAEIKTSYNVYGRQIIIRTDRYQTALGIAIIGPSDQQEISIPTLLPSEFDLRNDIHFNQCLNLSQIEGELPLEY